MKSPHRLFLQNRQHAQHCGSHSRRAAGQRPCSSGTGPCPGNLPGNYDLICLGYWVDRGMPDAKAKAYLEAMSGVCAALFGTLGAWPDSEHARECVRKSEALLREPARGNTVMGSFICQGKVDPHVIAMMSKTAASAHPMTPERKARLEEAAQASRRCGSRRSKGVFFWLLQHAHRSRKHESFRHLCSHRPGGNGAGIRPPASDFSSRCVPCFFCIWYGGSSNGTFWMWNRVLARNWNNVVNAKRQSPCLRHPGHCPDPR